MERTKLRFAILCGILVLLFSLQANGQELMFQKSVADSKHHKSFGPNRKNFVHPYLAAGFILPQNNHSLPTAFPNSFFAGAGARYKYKFSKPVALLAAAGINFHNYRAVPSIEFPFAPLIDRGTIHMQNFNVCFETGLRFRFGQKGDYLGNFLDVAFAAEAPMINTLIYRELINNASSTGIGTVRTTRSGVQGLLPVNFLAVCRLGFDRFSLYCSWRLSRLLKPELGPDLPKLNLGIEFSPVRY